MLNAYMLLVDPPTIKLVLLLLIIPVVTVEKMDLLLFGHEGSVEQFIPGHTNIF